VKKIFQWLSVICAAALIWWMAGAAERLPFDPSPLIAEKYAGWSGVLRLWVCEGWTDGGAFAGWLNRCISLYERLHSGVYVQAKYVDASAISSMLSSGVRLPDMVLYPPGLLPDAAALAALENMPARATLSEAGGRFAVPVLLAGYGWAVTDGENPSAPPDETFRRWTAALEALGSPRSMEENPSPEPPELDLGLPAMAASVQREPDALSLFASGKRGAAAVGYTELKKLDRLAQQGKGPDWTLLPGTFTDQVLYLSVIAGNPERGSLSAAFARHLLSDDCQSMLKEYGAFTVTDLPSGYPTTDARAVLERTLTSDALTVPGAFPYNS